MKALTYHSAWDVELRDVPDLHVAGDDDVVVDVRYCGICGTDLGIVSGSYPVAVSGVTLGHEASGIVAEVGSAVTSVAVGDRVVINPTPYCGRCRMCQTQRINHCVNKHGTESGVSYDGAYAGRYRTTSAFVHRVPDRVSLQAAALTEPLSCVVAGARKLQPPSLSAHTYVFGAGPLGLLYTWVLSLKGLTPVLIEHSPARLEFARDRLPDGSAAYQSLEEARSKYFNDPQAPLDVVVDTTSTLLEELFPQMACGGTYMSIGLKEKLASIDTMLLADRSLSVIGSIDSLHGSFVEAFHLITSGRIPAERLVSHVVPLAEYRRGFAALGCDIDGRRMRPADQASCKVLIAPGGVDE
ncbi:zinc-dependent alcohol dehydrogenase [Actinoplanes teichomyceticus]|uniref:Threonine dehydrogenase-like Zn-dependent dehydrogenase n=1 Tax=Actinoplanes teichomyceticus TaxID=1867 RepID=A0A561VKU0_ACTTI|nr:alcohol dehydrogenase catalytic domain-containing protein [Actinoplanes teichomyceticus]TWG12226.1 threonine dehydrogenase-like Zn-dependent dehydrogenase [Actinoplanes teichomyceticus]GIF14161.1 sorbitol dehydrogenase [Actinoplanes teichomyceticus]